jgi:hypothetical protein
MPWLNVDPANMEEFLLAIIVLMENVAIAMAKYQRGSQICLY